MGVSSGWAGHAVIREDEFQALVSASPPDAIMLDLQLANSDGVEQLQFLHDCHYAGAIVLMSGFDARVLSSAQQIGGALGLNIVSALEKPARPFRVREVLAQIARLPRSGVTAPAYARPPARGDFGGRGYPGDERRAHGVTSATDHRGSQPCSEARRGLDPLA